MLPGSVVSHHLRSLYRNKFKHRKTQPPSSAAASCRHAAWSQKSRNSRHHSPERMLVLLQVMHAAPPDPSDAPKRCFSFSLPPPALSVLLQAAPCPPRRSGWSSAPPLLFHWLCEAETEGVGGNVSRSARSVQVRHPFL